MKILKKVQKKINVFNEHCEIQKSGALHFLDIQNAFEVNLFQPREVDFFFYSRKKKNASNLKSSLEERGYHVERIRKLQEEVYSIYGNARLNSLEEGELLHWIEQMNEYAFIYDSNFDGWGMISRVD